MIDLQALIPYHEAGHAFIAFAHGRLVHVCIGKGLLDRHYTRRWATDDVIDLMFLLAGIASQRTRLQKLGLEELRCEVLSLEGADDDLDEALALAGRLYYERADEAMRRVVRLLLATFANEPAWAIVTAIANALEAVRETDDPVLRSADVHRIFTTTVGPRA